MGAPIYGKDLIPGTGGMLDLDDFSPRSTPNEYMAAPADACARFTDDAKREASPIFPISVDELQREFEAMLRGRCAVPLYARPTLSDVAMRQFVYVERTPLFRFPDILNVRFLRLGDESSTLVLHSASVFGASDLGKNEQRVKEMIKSLSTLTDATMPVILNATQPVANLANATQTNATAAAV
ncbi:hypothetical protein M885DRAFT_572994 [Pelagophyceae sp. CCMP2097]|nr:hypothetical protein M885DRAFT_572994 [Pelagophyceae sp. CCMP2097]